MDIATLIVLIAVLLMVLAYVFQPFLTGGETQDEGPTHGSKDELRMRAELLAERNRVYAAIRQLDFDHSTNKIADEDYMAQRHELVAQGVEALKQLDTLPPASEAPADDPVEAAVLAVRLGKPLAKVPTPARKAKAKGKSRDAGRTMFCPRCGKPVVQGDLFCGSCGNRL